MADDGDLWAGFLGNGDTVAACRAAISQGSLPATLLLAGEEGVGATTLARLLALEIVGRPTWAPSLEANPDVWIDDGQDSLKLNSILAGSTAVDVPLLQFLAASPFGTSGRAVIIARADRLTDEAANALLKILEEPPDATTIFLTASRPELLPATIVSRATVVALRPVDAGDISEWLRSRGVDGERADLIARHAAGRPGRALGYLAEPELLERELETARALLSVLTGTSSDALALADAVAGRAVKDGRRAAVEALALWNRLLTDLASARVGRPDRVRWAELRDELSRLASVMGIGRIAALVARSEETRRAIERYALPKLGVATFLLAAAGAGAAA